MSKNTFTLQQGLAQFSAEYVRETRLPGIQQPHKILVEPLNNAAAALVQRELDATQAALDAGQPHDSVLMLPPGLLDQTAADAMIADCQQALAHLDADHSGENVTDAADAFFAWLSALDSLTLNCHQRRQVAAIRDQIKKWGIEV